MGRPVGTQRRSVRARDERGGRFLDQGGERGSRSTTEMVCASAPRDIPIRFDLHGIEARRSPSLNARIAAPPFFQVVAILPASDRRIHLASETIAATHVAICFPFFLLSDRIWPGFGSRDRARPGNSGGDRIQTLEA
jgi:hypothetical protein